MTDKEKKSESNSKQRQSDSKEGFPLQEYRLVPVDSYNEHKEKENEIDLSELAKNIWEKRKIIVKVTIIFFVLGLLVAILIPDEYSSETTLLPEVSTTQNRAGSLLQRYGSLLGMSGSLNLGDEGVLPPQLYPQIVKSLPFQLALLNKRIYFEDYDTTTSVYNFIDNIYKPSFYSYIIDYTIGLPGIIKEKFFSEEDKKPLPKGFEVDSIISVTKDQMDIIDEMQKRVMVSLNEETGVISIIVKMPDANASAQVSKACIGLIKTYVTNYRTRKAKQYLIYAQNQLEDVKNNFEYAQNRLAKFRDSNLNLGTAKAQSQEQRLQSEYDLAFNVYNTVAQQVEQAKLNLQEQIPVVSILQPPQIPIEDNTSGLLILLAFILLGLFITVGYYIVIFLRKE